MQAPWLSCDCDIVSHANAYWLKRRPSHLPRMDFDADVVGELAEEIRTDGDSALSLHGL
jgi:hypothetical protein